MIPAYQGFARTIHKNWGRKGRCRAVERGGDEYLAACV